MRTKMMIYKSKFDALQRYALFQKVYTYKIFMCNDPLPKTDLAKSFFPFYARVMAFFDTVDEKHHQCVMYHIYNLDAFIKAEYICEKDY